MRLLITGLAALTLAGCQAPAPSPANDTGPNEAVVEDQLENEQGAEANAIDREALNEMPDANLE